MAPEQRPGSPPPHPHETSAEDNARSVDQTEFNPYQAAMEIYELVVEFLKQQGELRRPSEITSKEEMDDHFDDLRRVYQQTIIFLGLDWPPANQDVPPVDNEK